MPPRAAGPYSLAKSLNSFLMLAGGLLLQKPLNSSSKFRQEGSNSGVEALVATNAAGTCSQCRRSSRSAPSITTGAVRIKATPPITESWQSAPLSLAAASSMQPPTIAPAPAANGIRLYVRPNGNRIHDCTFRSWWYPSLWRIATLAKQLRVDSRTPVSDWQAGINSPFAFTEKYPFVDPRNRRSHVISGDRPMP